MELSTITGLFSSLKGPISKFLQQIIQEQTISYLQYGSNLDRLEQSVVRLQERRKRVQRRVDDESRNGKETAADVLEWLKNVEDIIAENDKFQKDKDLPYTVYSKGFLPKPGMRYRLGRIACTLAGKVDNLYKCSTFDGVYYGLRQMSIDFIVSVDDFESFKSRNVVMEKIREAMKKSTVRMIGIYGSGGVGKSTVVKRVASEAHDDKLFDVVVFVNVTKDPDIKNIQGQLADQLNARLDDESEIGRASRLRDIFKMEKKNTLVILDDLWDRLDLNKLGIPSDDDVRKEKEVRGYSKMFKILLTSRSKEVLFDKMDVKENSIFPIKGLQDKEAEILFNKVAVVADKPPEFGPLATEISKMCGGLPVAIVTIGSTLRNKNYSEWTNTLGQLQRQEFDGWAESAEFSTKLSFNHLKNEELKSTFVLCAQLGHHPLIMDLVKYCIGEGIFEGFLTVSETRERVLRMIEKLRDSSLLLDNYSNDRLNMHDMIRQVALSIASKEQHLFTMQNGVVHEWPHKNEFEMHSAISIHNCVIYEKLPDSVSCPRLKIFQFDSLDPYINIPGNFFGRMIELRALILTGIDMSNFPTSIGCLTNLRMLCLEQCKLGDISLIGVLKQLRILSLSGSKIVNLPTELGQLHKLQLLDISNCSELREIPSNVLASLNNLEELYMRNSVNWESEGNQSGNAILTELRDLHQLKNLDICLPSIAALPSNLFLDNLDRYKIVIGYFEMPSVGDFKMPHKYEATRVLALQITEEILIHSQKGVKMLFRRVEKVLLGELNGVKDIFYELNLGGFPYLKQLSIVKNSEIKCIINSREFTAAKDAFPNLESLCLYELENMRKISFSKVTGTSFSKLKVVKIQSCEKLKNMFSISMVKLLGNLETIDVSYCISMKTIVAKEKYDADERVDEIFPKLHSMVLQTLPKFSGVYFSSQGGSADICLFKEQVAIPNLESLELSSINMYKIWSNQSKQFENLSKLNVEDCNRIEYLFSFSMARSLKNLKSVSISGCKKMVEIFKYESNVLQEVRKERVFPMLEEIHLTSMDNLTSIWPSEVGENSFGSLNFFTISSCHKIETALPSHVVGRYGRLENLRISFCDQVKVIFDLKGAKKSSIGDETQLQVLEIVYLPKLECVWNEDPIGILNFKKLHCVEVTECENLKYLFPVSVVRGLQELDSLYVLNCAGMEEIVHNIARKEGSSKSSITFEFPEVTLVSMERLPKLERFYKEKHSVKCPKLKKLSVISCDKLEFNTETTNLEGGPIFLLEEIIPNLENMEISFEEAERLKRRIINYCMNYLNQFVLNSCPSVEILYWFLNRMPSLESLILNDCNIRELIPTDRHLTQPNIGNVVQLKYLSLYYLSALENIGFQRDPVLQKLEHFHLSECHKLISLAPSSVTLTHLTSLEVHECEGLKNLVGFSTAKSLVQLVSLKVNGCTSLEKIVAEQNDEVQITCNPEIIFSKLKTLELEYLECLTCFCSSEIHVLKFPSLEKLIVKDCPEMTKFCKQVTTAPNLQLLLEGEEIENWYWKGDVNAPIIRNFIDSHPSNFLVRLELSNHAELEYIWHHKIPLSDNSFRKLKTLVVENCEFLSNVIPSHLLPYLENLTDLEVRSCKSVVAIFDVDDNVEAESDLKNLTLDQLPNMKHVWNKNPQGILSFENIAGLHVIDCDCLQTLFPSVRFAKDILSELVVLEIRNCGALEEIVGNVEAFEGVIEEFEFQHLRFVTLCKLPELKYFYSGRMKLQCPQLKALRVYHCGKLQIFASESQSYQGAVAENLIGTSNDSQSLFSIREVISSMNELSLNKEEAMMLCNEDIPATKLFSLRLYCFHDVRESDELPFEILHKFSNPLGLTVACSDFHEIFPQTLPVGFAESKIAGLRLEDLCNLTCIGLEHPCMNSLRVKLKSIRVERCPRLTKLIQSPVSFHKLGNIEIGECHGLEYLFTAPTARSLLQLQQLRIWECGSIKEIVAQEEDGIDDTTHEIIFEKLNKVILHSLPRLACFYTGTCPLEFQHLYQLKIDECPNMKFFSHGCIYAPSKLEPDIPPLVNKDDWRFDIEFSSCWSKPRDFSPSPQQLFNEQINN